MNTTLSSKFFFLLLTITYLLVSIFTNIFIYSNNFILNQLTSKISYERIETYIALQGRIKLIGYFFLPVILLIKISFPAICIYIVTNLMNLEISFKYIFKLCLQCELIFLTAAIIRFIYFLVNPPTTISDVSNFAPLSLAQILSYHYPTYLTYLFQSINLFELVFIGILSIRLHLDFHISRKSSIILVLSGYGSGLIFLIVSFTYILVTFN